MSTSKPRRDWSTPSGVGRPLTCTRFRPSRERTRRRISSLSSEPRRSCSCRNVATGPPAMREKTPETSASSAPARMRSVEARPPTNRSTASTRMDFPAPVSPVNTVKPSANSSPISSMMAKLRMRSSVNTRELQAVGALRRLSTASLRSRFGTAPTTFSTGWPFLKNRRVGMLMMPYLPAMSGFSSVLSFTTLSLPSYSVASSSMQGAIIWQGPHHTAQKSTRTRPLALPTSVSHVVALTGMALPTIPLHIKLVHEIVERNRSLPYPLRGCQRTVCLHPLRSRRGTPVPLGQGLQVVDQVFEVGAAQTCPARHLLMEDIPSRINACEHGRLDRLPIEGRMAAVGKLMVVPFRIRQGREGDVGSRDAVHHAATSVRAVAHGATHAFHAVAVLQDQPRCRRSMQKDAPAVIGMRDRNWPTGASRPEPHQQNHRADPSDARRHG